MKLHSNIIGEGQPLLILHGFLGMGDNWKTLGKRFADEGFEAHLIDQRNHGRSPHSKAFSYSLMAEDLHDYCEQHAINDAYLLGHSMGGKTAMLAACEYPELFSRLVVVDIAPKHYPQHHQEILKGLSSLNFKSLKSRGDADKQLSNYVEEVSVRQFLLKNLFWVEKGKLGLRMNIESLIDNIESVGEGLPEGKTYQQPTLFVSGALSGYIQDDDESLIENHFTNFNIIEIPNAGHWVHAENADVFFNEVINFIK